MEGWIRTKFGAIANRKSVRISDPKESNYDRYVGLEHLDSGELVVKKWGKTQDVSSNMQLFNKGDILFARRNTHLRRVSLALFDGVCSGDIIVIEPVSKLVNPRFLPIYMQFDEFENRVIAWSAGAFSKRIKWKQMSEFDIFIPPIKVQQKIIQLIWTIYETQAKIENLILVSEKLRRGLNDKLLTKGVNAEELKKSKLGQIPKDWEVKQLVQCVKEPIQNGISLTAPRNETCLWNLTLSALTPNGFDENKIKPAPISVDINKYSLKYGDVLVSRSNTRTLVGLSAMYRGMPNNCIYPDLMMRVRTNPDIINPEFLELWMQHQDVRYFLTSRARGTSGSMVKINQKILNSVFIPIPPIEQQNEIIGIINTVSNFITSLKHNLIDLSHLRKNLINKMLSGDINFITEDKI